jgi:hypothetical protein
VNGNWHLGYWSLLPGLDVLTPTGYSRFGYLVDRSGLVLISEASSPRIAEFEAESDQALVAKA